MDRYLVISFVSAATPAAQHEGMTAMSYYDDLHGAGLEADYLCDNCGGAYVVADSAADAPRDYCTAACEQERARLLQDDAAANALQPVALAATR